MSKKKVQARPIYFKNSNYQTKNDITVCDFRCP